MARLIQKGDIIDYTNAASGSGDAVISVGSFIGVVQNDIGIGETGSVAITGVWEAPVTTGKTFDIGDPVYWDSANGKATDSGGSGKLYMGRAWAAVAATDEVIRVRLEPAGDAGGEG